MSDENLSEQYRAVCRGEFEHIHRKLDRIDQAIRGNGQAGIQVRLDRLEVARAGQVKLSWIVVGATMSMIVISIWKLVLGG